MSKKLLESDIDWDDLKQVFLGMGPERRLRDLQFHIRDKYNLVFDLANLRNEVTKRNWQIQAMEYDKRVEVQVDAQTTEVLVQKLTQSRLMGIAKVSGIADNVGNYLEAYVQKHMAKLEEDDLFDPKTFSTLVNAYIKLEDAKQKMEAPVLPENLDEEESLVTAKPEDIAKALILVSKGRGVTIEEMHQKAEKIIDVTPNKKSEN